MNQRTKDSIAKLYVVIIAAALGVVIGAGLRQPKTVHTVETVDVEKLVYIPSEIRVDVPTSGDISLLNPAARQALNLLRLHESLNGRLMVGDGGKARGWLQQHSEHWARGCEYLGVDWVWPDDTANLRKCEWVALGNWLRDHKEHLVNGDVEMLIRTFRLPFAPMREDNDAYLQAVLDKGHDLREGEQ